jgi:hypothetical protein
LTDGSTLPYRGQEYIRVTIEALVQYAATLQARGILNIVDEQFNVSR